MSWFLGLSPFAQAALATCFTWGLTALGAAAVFFFAEPRRKLLDAMLGLASGVMIAASFWSLLAPAIELAEAAGKPPRVPAALGFLAGGAFLFMVDKILPHLHPGMTRAEGIPSGWRRSALLVLAITLHNKTSIARGGPWTISGWKKPLWPAGAFGAWKRSSTTCAG